MAIGMKVFTATRSRDRETLGEVLTAWLHENPHIRVVGQTVTQSSDDSFHCLTITLIYETASR
jgi:hypothetical protein